MAGREARMILRAGKSSEAKGFTLVEVMVAVAICSITIVSIYYAFMNISDTIIRVDNYNQLVLVAREEVWKLEEALREADEEINIEDLSGEQSEGNRFFRWRFTSESIPAYESVLQQINLKMDWQEGRRKGAFEAASYLRQKQK